MATRPRRNSVRFVRQFTNGFTGLTWRVYDGVDRDGFLVKDIKICVRAYFAPRRKTNAECRAEALGQLNEVR